jgi:alcohol dehydrogenase class IV
MQLMVSKRSRKLANKLMFAVGGGGLIDEAKIYAKQKGKILIAIPTTGAGATETTHAVVWGKEKINIPTDKPISIPPPFTVKLDEETRRNTIFDILGHVVDFLSVCSDNEVVEVGMYAGRLIERRKTNLTHPASYPLTLKFGIPHGEAVGRVLNKCINKAWPIKGKKHATK